MFRVVRRHRLPPQWRRYRARRLPSAQEWWAMGWIGIFAGLASVYFGGLIDAPRSAVQPRAVMADARSDPWAESRRSRAILSRQETAPPPVVSVPDASPTLVAQPVRVIDGDTFDYRGERIRIADIDTPEIAGQCPFEIAAARRATDRLRVLLAAGPFELRRSGRDEDVYGRKLRIVTRNGRSLGDQLVREGLARTWTGRREPWCS